MSRTQPSKSVDTPIRALYQQTMAACSKGSGKGVSAIQRQDRDLAERDRTPFRGRWEISWFHRRLFRILHEATLLLGRSGHVLRFL